MCGIVGAISERNVGPILIEGLKRLEYRGYDSAGMVLMNSGEDFNRIRTVGKVIELEREYQKSGLGGVCGIAHTRWATHGKPSIVNAHPHVSSDRVALVHNGIIENYQELRTQLSTEGYEFLTETDTEVIAHLVDKYLSKTKDLLAAVQKAVLELEGAYALGVVSKSEPNKIIACRRGSPLVIGLGFEERFLASDVHALLPVTQRFIFLKDNDVAVIERNQIKIFDLDGNTVEREERRSELSSDAANKGRHKHYMLKEIYEQPEAIANTLEGRVSDLGVLPGVFGADEEKILSSVKSVKIVACGTSYHAGCVARYWIEKLADVPCTVEIASEFRYRRVVVKDDALLVTISQSGETADTLAALQYAKERGFKYSLAICNVPESSLVRESDLVLMTRAGPEIGVASTKAFTTQLVALFILALKLTHYQNPNPDLEASEAAALLHLPAILRDVLKLDPAIQGLSEDFIDKQHTLFLARGTIFPIALEGALKLKEISYIHAEGYPSGELKHGPLALVDADMPVVTIAPNNELMDKLKSNLQEVRARGGQLYVFADKAFAIESEEGMKVIEVPSCPLEMAPIIFTIPLQLLAYHVAVLRGTDVDQPRNLAKSVTVE
ncbi:MAG: glutamine--fructose-6-phosphate transaminase (isomerizing) [Gammaproteobacteria bacterium]|nr:glutamine--fructose-6-phosphate transaminase (isomerizing) [Gammaproteobacteria bacterium]